MRTTAPWFLLVSILWFAPGCSDNAAGGSEGSEETGSSETGMRFGTSEGGDTGDELPGEAGEETSPEETGGGEGFCTPGTTDCMNSTSLGVCSDDGAQFIEQACAEGQGCLAGECVEQGCTPGEKNGQCASTYEFFACNESGTQFVPAACTGATKCYQGDCSNLFCVPDSTVCYGIAGFKECDSQGQAFSEPELCPEGTTCQQDGAFGNCVDACEANVKANIYLGCDYYAVDLDNIEGGAKENVALVVSVPPDQGQTASVSITDMATGVILTAAQLGVTSTDIAPGALETFLLPNDPTTQGNPLNGSVHKAASYKIASSAPVTVHQFNPLNGDGVYTNDASLLLPSNLGGTEYLVMSWPHREGDGTAENPHLRGFFAVIATETGTTQVEVFSRGAVAGGIGVYPMQPNTSQSFTLIHGDVLNIETDGVTGTDLTGSWIKSSQRVTVLGGHECANIPLGVNYCDHIEQQLYPVNTWGNSYVADPFYERGPNQFDLWRIMGAEDYTTVTTDPPVLGYEQFTLHKGSFVEFQTSEPFVVEASGRILLGHYMTGSNYPGFTAECNEGSTPSGIGDPAMTLGVPVEQYLKSYSVLIPPGYSSNFVNVIVPIGSTASIDGVPIDETSYIHIGSTGYRLAQEQVEPGVHSVTGDAAFGLTAYGYACDVSYAYPGGLKLQSIAQP
jgi:hypothetical protein